ncbi:MAG: hypothetical protein JOZ32_18330 [Bryobacterales bacterium]|nr:hypothetical protein [Bryobacterales bacterium]
MIKSIQKDTDLRLILPFGLDLRIGDVISVGKDGNFTLQGTCASLLDRPAGPPRLSGGSVGLMRQSGKNTSFRFRAAGAAPAAFDGLQSAKAGFDISFGSANGWVLAITGRTLASLDKLDRFRRPILDAYRWKVWKPDWALVTSAATVERMTLIASVSSNTKVALALSGQVAQNGPLEAQFTAGASVLATSNEIIQCILDEPRAAFCSAIRVKDPWWRFWSHGDVGSLAARAISKDPEIASDDEFWEGIDDLDPS